MPFQIQDFSYPGAKSFIQHFDEDGFQGGMFVHPGNGEELRDAIDAHLIDRARQLAEAKS